MQRNLVLVLALMAPACGSSDVTIEQVQAEVFTPSCTFSRCHVGATPAGQLALDADSRTQLVGVSSVQRPDTLRVAAGAPDSSYLLDKILGRNLADQTTLMPPSAALEPERIELVRDWIATEGRNPG